ncbi:hypothetical protein EG328_004111 [Venturia inaequalis]|uniref:Uncharacterized protein n=1 Tax=Venturia inaequalis TaxID=5025 RepID=A0A8H3Z6A3_VENIN|nr:hypothetical protein EG328_004111 [Venturia inaequalis]
MLQLQGFKHQRGQLITIEEPTGPHSIVTHSQNNADYLPILTTVQTGTFVYWNTSTLLWWAASEGQLAVCEWLITSVKVDLDHLNEDNATPLLIAAQSGHEAVFELFFSREARHDIENCFGFSAICENTANAEGNTGTTLLLAAVQYGYTDVVRMMVHGRQVNLDLGDREGRTPLWWSVAQSRYTISEIITGSDRADVNRSGTNGCSPLIMASQHGDAPSVALLLADQKLEADACDHAGRSALWSATSKGWVAIVRSLMASGKVYTNKKDNGGDSPFTLAVVSITESIEEREMEVGFVPRIVDAEKYAVYESILGELLSAWRPVGSNEDDDLRARPSS